MTKKPIYDVTITGYLPSGNIAVNCMCFSRNSVVNFIDSQLGSSLPQKVSIVINRYDPQVPCATTQLR